MVSTGLPAHVLLITAFAGCICNSLAASTANYAWLPIRCGGEPDTPAFLQRTWPGRQLLQNGTSQWPWIAMIASSSGPALDWHCAGAIIGPQHVLTSATCLKEMSTGRLSVWAGAMYRAQGAVSGHQLREVTRVAVHPRMRSQFRDVAVLTLSDPLQATPSVQYACLPNEGSHDARAQKLLPYWGIAKDTTMNEATQKRDHLEYPIVLGQAVQKTIWPEQCSGYLSRLHNNEVPQEVSDTLICTYTDQQDYHRECVGTRSGPLFQQQNGVYTVIGVMSMGQACTDHDAPNLFSSVSDPQTLHWIKSIQ